VQRILRHSSITVTTRTYVEAVQRDALDSMGTLFAVEPEKASGRSQLSSIAPSVAHDERVLPGGAKGTRTPADQVKRGSTAVSVRLVPIRSRSLPAVSRSPVLTPQGGSRRCEPWVVDISQLQ
jgi:hypothetical protein